MQLRDFLDGRASKQEVFNYVAEKIINQGKPSGTVTKGGRFTCLYNGADNCHCAIGWLLTDIPPMSMALLEGHDVDEVVGEMVVNLNPATVDACCDFLADLQMSHDAAADNSFDTFFVRDFKQCMRKVAEKHQLDGTSVAA